MHVAVFGATGKTGSAVARKLLARDHDVRAIVRDPGRATELADGGAQLCVCEVNDPQDVYAAVAGAVGVYYCSPVPIGYERPFEVERVWAGNVIEASAAAGVKHLVLLSAMGPESAPGIELIEAKRAVEHALRKSGVPFTILRPSMFMDNIAAFLPEALRAAGLHWPFAASASLQPVAANDIAEIAVRALEAGAQDQSFDVVGPETLTLPQMAATLGKALGFAIAYTEISDDVFAEQVGPLMGSVEVARAVAGAYRQWEKGGSGVADPAVLEDAFGVSLTPFEDFCERLAENWRSQGML